MQSEPYRIIVPLPRASNKPIPCASNKPLPRVDNNKPLPHASNKPLPRASNVHFWEGNIVCLSEKKI
jgi:hypothetical protein